MSEIKQNFSILGDSHVRSIPLQYYVLILNFDRLGAKGRDKRRCGECPVAAMAQYPNLLPRA